MKMQMSKVYFIVYSETYKVLLYPHKYVKYCINDYISSNFKRTQTNASKFAKTNVAFLTECKLTSLVNVEPFDKTILFSLFWNNHNIITNRCFYFCPILFCIQSTLFIMFNKLLETKMSILVAIVKIIRLMEHTRKRHRHVWMCFLYV